MEFQTFDVCICNGNKKCPMGTSKFYTDFLGILAISCFHCIAIAKKEVQTTICNSLLTIVTTSWQNGNKIGLPKLHEILIFFDKKPFYYVNHF